MMKRSFLSLILALVLAFSLAVPALADGYGVYYIGDDYQEFLEAFPAQYRADHPEEMAAFDPQAWYARKYYVDKAQFMEWNGLADEDAFVASMEEDYLVWQTLKAYQQKTVDEYRAAYPGELEALDVDQMIRRRWGDSDDPVEYLRVMLGYDTRQDVVNSIYDYYISQRDLVRWQVGEAARYLKLYPEAANLDVEQQAGILYFGTPAEYMAENSILTDEEFRAVLVCNWGQWKEATEYNARQMEEFLLSHGGVVDQFNVMVNGQCLKFEDGKLPYLQNGDTTFVPADVLSEALGIPVEGDSDGYARFRAVCEANGYAVGWDSWLGMPMACSDKAFAAMLDESCTVINRVGALMPFLDLAWYGPNGYGWPAQGQAKTAGELFSVRQLDSWRDGSLYPNWDDMADWMGRDWLNYIGDDRFTQTNGGWTYVPDETAEYPAKLAMTVTNSGVAEGTITFSTYLMTFRAVGDESCTVSITPVKD